MWAALLASMSQRINEKRYRKDTIKKAQDEALANGPSWKYRRRLIHGAYILGFAMVIFGAATVFMDSQIGVEMIIGGVALVSIIVTAYTTSASYEDVRLWNHNPRIRFGGDSEPMHGDYDTNNPDGT